MKRLLVIALLFAACDKKPAPPVPEKTAAAAEKPAVAGDPCSKLHPEGDEQMPWIADDLPTAPAGDTALALKLDSVQATAPNIHSPTTFTPTS